MIQPWPATITETENVSNVRATLRRRHREVEHEDLSHSRSRTSRVTTTFSRSLAPVIVALSALTLSGCMTTAEHAREHRAITCTDLDSANSIITPEVGSSGESVGLVRLQSPADVAESYGAAAQPVQPPLADPSLPSSAPDEASVSAAPPSMPPSVAATPTVATAADASSSVSGLSSIARNRRANRGVPNPTPSGTGDTGLGDLNPRLRARLEGSVAPGEEARFNEFRIFSNGFTAQAAMAKQKVTTGYSPLAFDFKANFWEENTKYHIPAMGLEVYLQTTFGSPAFSGGTQPSMNVLFDPSLPLGIGFE